MQSYIVYHWKLLYMIRVVSPPIIRNANNCSYSIWYLSNRYAICRYRGRVGTGLSVVLELICFGAVASVLYKPLNLFLTFRGPCIVNIF